METALGEGMLPLLLCTSYCQLKRPTKKCQRLLYYAVILLLIATTTLEAAFVSPHSSKSNSSSHRMRSVANNPILLRQAAHRYRSRGAAAIFNFNSRRPAVASQRSFLFHRSTPALRMFSANPVASTENNGSDKSNNVTVAATASTVPSRGEYTPYEKWVRRLYQTNLFHPVKLGLENIDRLHKLLGQPLDKTTVIHIAGTNGKGSVALKIAKTLELSNPSLKVGLFCSPHVSSFRERMQINGDLITEEEVVEYLPEIYKLCKTHEIPATFFEITTALAYMFFDKRHADVIVLETGLGGRLDATNVVAAPAISIITSIGLEHTRILGDTIEQIALEKGGIIKPGRPVLCGPHVPHDVLRTCAAEKQAGPYYTCDDVLGKVSEDITDYDEENARIATAALTLLQESHPDTVMPISPEVMAVGTLKRPPCRFETFVVNGVRVVLDVAHNPPAMEYLVNKLQQNYPKDAKFRTVVGMSSDKDLKLCASSLLKATKGDASLIHLVEAFHPRAATLEAILEAEPLLQNSHWETKDRSITRQIQSAMALAQQKNDEVLVVCGSVFLMAEAREALGFDEPRDSECISEVAGCNLRHGQENFGNTPTTEETEEKKVASSSTTSNR